MRRILVDSARAHLADKRGGRLPHVYLDDSVDASPQSSEDLVALDDALHALEEMDPRKARVVELRFFAGLSVEQTAEALKISAPSVKRDWKLAKAWLSRELSRR
jgi:RNA polymerase sigma factor (TIGR02999 family)